jgi:hypothetical protein
MCYIHITITLKLHYTNTDVILVKNKKVVHVPTYGTLWFADIYHLNSLSSTTDSGKGQIKECPLFSCNSIITTQVHQS